MCQEEKRRAREKDHPLAAAKRRRTRAPGFCRERDEGDAREIPGAAQVSPSGPARCRVRPSLLSRCTSVLRTSMMVRNVRARPPRGEMSSSRAPPAGAEVRWPTAMWADPGTRPATRRPTCCGVLRSQDNQARDGSDADRTLVRAPAQSSISRLCSLVPGRTKPIFSPEAPTWMIQACFSYSYLLGVSLLSYLLHSLTRPSMRVTE